MWLVKAALMSPDTQPACLKSLAALVTYTVTSEQIILCSFCVDDAALPKAHQNTFNAYTSNLHDTVIMCCQKCAIVLN